MKRKLESIALFLLVAGQAVWSTETRLKLDRERGNSGIFAQRWIECSHTEARMLSMLDERQKSFNDLAALLTKSEEQFENLKGQFKSMVELYDEEKKIADGYSALAAARRTEP